MSIDLLLMPLLLPLDTFDMFIKHLLNIYIVDLKYLSNRGTPRSGEFTVPSYVAGFNYS